MNKRIYNHGRVTQRFELRAQDRQTDRQTDGQIAAPFNAPAVGSGA